MREGVWWPALLLAFVNQIARPSSSHLCCGKLERPQFHAYIFCHWEFLNGTKLPKKVLARRVQDKKEIFVIIVLLTAGPHACKQSFEECVYLPGLTHRLFVQSSSSHLFSVCSKLSKCPSVLPLITFATLDRQTWQQISKCPCGQVSCPLSLLQHKITEKTSLSQNYFLFSFILITRA